MMQRYEGWRRHRSATWSLPRTAALAGAGGGPARLRQSLDAGRRYLAEHLSDTPRLVGGYHPNTPGRTWCRHIGDSVSGLDRADARGGVRNSERAHKWQVLAGHRSG